MSHAFHVPVDFKKNELLNPRAQNLSTAPSSPVTGQFYYDTDDNKGYMWNGSSWVSMLEGGAAGIPASIVDVKGDLIVASAADTVVRKAAGTNGHLLVANSAQADGLEWRALVDGDIPSSIFRDAEHTAGSHSGVSISNLAAPTGDVAFGGFKITGLGTPTAASDAATRGYVDGIAQGIDAKNSVRAATTAAGTLATSFENADVIDGVTLATGDRILIKNQASAQENGIYTVNASGAPTRATDADAWNEIIGAFVWVEEGTVNSDTGWISTANAGGTLGTTAMPWVQFASAAAQIAGNGLTKSGNTFDVGAGTGIVANADDVAVLRTDANGRVPLRYALTFGNGSATSFNIDHNLNSLDVIVQVVEVSTGATITCDVTRTTVNRVVLDFAAAPTTNQFRVVVLG